MTYTHTETNLPVENEYPKLVRDKIPEIIHQHEGVQAPTRVLEDDTEYEAYLRRKIIEEAAELAATETDDHTIEEMADLEELIDALLALKKLDRAQVTAAQSEKREKRGGFAKRLLMLDSVKNTSR
ncbi:MAG TPA: nucleoside triphosphate pyrophosphohydrolase [Candidatus Saccharimonadales bacterium]|nr:nucleoside triphosphate pyrophosphohydrolase [Candidatus Saccharimonadales bacterium]